MQKLRIVTHGGEELTVEVEKFDAKEFEKKLNSQEYNMVELGGFLFSRIDVKLVIPIIGNK